MSNLKRKADVFDFPTAAEDEAEAKRVEAKRIKKIGEEVSS